MIYLMFSFSSEKIFSKEIFFLNVMSIKFEMEEIFLSYQTLNNNYTALIMVG